MSILLENRKIDLDPIHFEHNDCLEDQLISVIGWFRKDIPIDHLIWHLCEVWNFTFKESKNQKTSLGRALVSDAFTEYEVYKKYYGVAVNLHTIETLDDFIEVAKKELSMDRPVVIIQKSYWIPWDPNFKINKEYTHAYIVLDIDLEQKRMIAADGLYMQKNVSIPFENVRKGFTGEYYTFHLEDNAVTLKEGSETWRNSLKPMLEKVHVENNQDSMFHHMNEFADRVELLNELSLENQAGSTDFVTSDLYNALSTIINSRKKIARFMKYLEGRNNIKRFSDFVVLFDLAATKWYDIQHKFLKASFLSDFSVMRNRIAMSIREVAELEKNIALDLQNFILLYDQNVSNQRAISNAMKEPEKYKKISLVNLENCFNNKGFGEIGHDGASFAAGGQFFSTKHLPEKAIWDVKGIKFHVPNITKISLDNLTCNGQIISVEKDQYNCFMLLGCSEQNSFTDEVEIYYSDGSNEKVIISLSDWYLPPQFEDCIAWQGNIVEKVDGSSILSTHLYQIFASKYRMNLDNKHIISIKLPECLNMHLFAISLGIS